MKWKLLFLFLASSWLMSAQDYSGVVKKRLQVSDGDPKVLPSAALKLVIKYNYR